jgi:microcystin-dependent protein
MWFGNTTTTPPGYIAADGSAVSRTTYASLFAVIGTTYGVGDGSTTFNVPSVAATTGKYFIRYTTSVGTVTTTALSSAPVGTLIDWPTSSSFPTGWLEADGSAVSRTSYADLFSLIGTDYGVGDGSSTFNLPNFVSAGAPLKIIKATVSGITEPSTVAHASSHAAGGSDPISIKQSQINDFVFTTEAARDAAITSPVEGMRVYLTAPTIPAATGVETYVPTGVQTIYNGSVWVCVTEVGAFTSDQGNTTSTSYTATLNGGNTNPSVTLVTGTTVVITLSASMLSNGGTSRMGIAVSGASTISASDAKCIRHEDLSNAAANERSHGATLMLTGLTAGTNTFTLQYKHTVIAANTSYFRNRMLTVRGIA